MKKWLAFILAVILFFTLHEGLHALTASFFNEYQAFQIRPLGMEVIFKTPVAERSGSHWALISGASNLATVALGYILLSKAKTLGQPPFSFFQTTAYYLTFLGLFLDPLNLSLGPLLYGGDAIGIAFGLGISTWIIQVIFLIVFLINHELVARRLIPAYGVETDHFLFRPWFGSALRA